MSAGLGRSGRASQAPGPVRLPGLGRGEPLFLPMPVSPLHLSLLSYLRPDSSTSQKKYRQWLHPGEEGACWLPGPSAQSWLPEMRVGGVPATGGIRSIHSAPGESARARLPSLRQTEPGREGPRGLSCSQPGVVPREPPSRRVSERWASPRGLPERDVVVPDGLAEAARVTAAGK